MPNNYVLLERIELNASAASVTFANIPQTGYTDLKVVMSVRNTDSANDQIWISLNGSTTGFTNKLVYGNGASALSASIDRYVANIATPAYTANSFNNAEIYIPNYAGSTNKSISSDSVNETNATTAYAALTATLWSDTAAITSITLTPQAGSLVQYSTFSLYGIAALGTTPAIAPKASGGNIIDFDGTYWIHTFLSSGTFTPQVGLTADVLVVAGGGAGGSASGTTGGAGGGGGAGAFRTATAQSLTATTYNVTVGAGGPGTSNRGSNGSDSVFSSITSLGGGGGGDSSASLRNGSNGGSGGGGANSGATGGTGNTGGNNGGNGDVDNYGGYPLGGGGGGASAVGGSASLATSTPGNGGNGSASSYSGSSVTYAGGGGGSKDSRSPNPNAQGTGGTGGGGNAGAAGSAGTVNRGGGGGGSGTNGNNGGNGGSGIIIIRYLA